MDTQSQEIETVDPNAEEEWERELARRTADIRAGKVEGVPLSKALAHLRERLTSMQPAGEAE